MGNSSLDKAPILAYTGTKIGNKETEMQMEIEVIIPVTVVVNYDMEDSDMPRIKTAVIHKTMEALRSSLERVTTSEVKDRILDLMDETMVDAVTDANGRRVNGASIQIINNRRIGLRLVGYRLREAP